MRDDYVYISSTKYLVTLQKTINSRLKTDLNKNIKKINELLIIKIIDKQTNELVDEAKDCQYDHNQLTYKVGSIIKSQKCTIHVFESYEKAYYWNILHFIPNYSGNYKQWDNNGDIQFECNYQNGILINIF